MGFMGSPGGRLGGVIALVAGGVGTGAGALEPIGETPEGPGWEDAGGV